MADITMCKREDCPLSAFCYRFNAHPNESYQSYSNFENECGDGIYFAYMEKEGDE